MRGFKLYSRHDPLSFESELEILTAQVAIQEKNKGLGRHAGYSNYDGIYTEPLLSQV